jgi:glycosyltransferase involved in cell wall biosynthesis
MTTPLPIVVDAQSVLPGVSGTGTATYAEGLLGALAHHRELAVRALCAPGAPLPAGIGPVEVHRRSTRPRARVIENSVRLPIEVWRARSSGSVFHNLGYHAVPALGSPWVQTLHDVIPLAYPSADLAALRRRWRRFARRYRRAAAVIAVSRHAADDGMSYLGLRADQLHVAPHGVSPAFGPGAGPADPPYLLMVGEYSARKGFADGFAVIDALAEAGYPHRLVVVGRDHGTGAFEAMRAASAHPDRIDLRALVADVVPLYQGATALLMPSRAEGFGLPALEAMACGVPVVAYANTAVTEISGPAARLVADGDGAALIAAVRQVLDQPSLAAELAQRGLEHAAQFTWARSAAIHAEVYRAVAGIQ